ncbi:MAG: histidine phosphatase family protein [Alphaproteobacteria bacterium]|nr:histidine phosphatase family protein [Alphaproteobacteria bacterium]
MPFDAVTQAALPSAEVTHLHLLRHGEVDTGGRRLAYGHADLPLTAQGEADTRALLGFCLHHLPRPDGVLSSDLRRCTALAEPLAEALGVPLATAAALREQHMGDWEGAAWEDLTRADPQGIADYWEGYAAVAPPGGESYGDVQRRVDAWWAQSAASLRGRRWLVVTHIGVIRALLCSNLGIPMTQALRWAPARASHTHLLLARAGAVLQALGERPSPPVVGARPSKTGLTLALSGSAGVGKTTLGRALAGSLGLPFIAEGMRARLEAGLNLHSLTHEALQALILELWAEQRAAEDAAIAQSGGFVADRSSVDFAAFWLYYGFAHLREPTAAFLAETLGHAARYDRVLLLPWGVLPLQADGVRSSNPWVQRHFQAVVEGLLGRELAPGRLLRMPALDGLDARLGWTLRAMGGPGPA